MESSSKDSLFKKSLNTREKKSYSTADLLTREAPYICKICGKGFQIKYFLTVHYRNHSSTQKHVCDVCQKSYRYKASFDKHQRTCHSKLVSSTEDVFSKEPIIVKLCIPKGEKLFVCDVCKKEFISESELNHHLSIFTDSKPFICDVCLKNFKTLKLLLFHYRAHVNEKCQSPGQMKSYFCYVCFNISSSQQELDMHMVKHCNESSDNENKCVCGICNKVFLSKKYLSKHLEIHHYIYAKSKPFICSMCRKAFSSNSTLLNHHCVHTSERLSISDADNTCNIMVRLFENCHVLYDEKAFVCDLCKQSFTSESDLNHHHHMYSDNKPFSCDICFKTFKQIRELLSHYHIHIDKSKTLGIVKPYFCYVCFKKHASQVSLDLHMVGHCNSVNGNYTCGICNRAYWSKSVLRKHLEVIHQICATDKLFICNICDKGFTGNNSLFNHFRIHTGERPFVCDVCQRSFIYKNQLRRHYLKHTDGIKKKHVCDFCSKAFSSKKYLMHHLRVHTGEKPHVCDICQKACTQRTNLAIHYRTHTNETPYVCDVCQTGFRYKPQLIKHLQVTSCGANRTDSV